MLNSYFDDFKASYTYVFRRWGFAQIWRRFLRCFLLAFIFQRDGIFTPVFDTIFALIVVCRFMRRVLRRFIAQISVRRFLRRFLVLNQCADVFTEFCADFSADFSQEFWCFKNRCFRVTQKCAQNLRKNLRRPNGLSWGGVPTPSLLP